MNKFTYVTVLLFLSCFSLNAQIETQKLTPLQKAEKYLSIKGELTFTFKVSDHTEIDNYARELSIVNYDSKTNTLIAWANEKQFRAFESKNIVFEVPVSENEVDEAFIYDTQPQASRGIQANTLTFPLASYPTYADYAQQMQDFEDDNPTLVEKISLGSTAENDGKELLFVKISDNIGTDEQEPKLMLTSSMHGDEIAGYPMMLSLIDYILTVYGNTGHADHARVKNLVENAEIWINPSANPDGTYYGSAGNTSVSGSRRGNFYNIDLNRNYPDNVAGPHDDGNAYQVETLAFMALADANHFVIAANFHGGTELVNYPFDNAYVSQYTHPDSSWFEYISVEYATHAQNDSDTLGDTTYMTADDDWDGNPSYYMESPGVTHGAEWYRVYGGRQDYMNYYQQCREITVELSDTKILPQSQLVNYWLYNRDALLDFLTQGTYGFTGVVKDIGANNPIDATVKLVGHDNYESHTVTDLSHGDYYRPVKAGTYDLLFEAPCYESFTLTNQTIADYQKIVLSDVLLTPAIVAPPTGVSASGIGSSTASIDWDATGTSYDFRYRVLGAPSWIDVTGLSNNSYALSSLTPSTQYEVQVLVNCNTTSSAYSSSVLFTTTAVNYCDSASTNSNYEWISRVQLNTLDNTSGAGNYSDFSGDVGLKTTLTQNQEYTITITPEWSSSTYAEAYKVWIDFNKNGDFTDSGEQVVNIGTTMEPTVSGTFTIPSNIEFGTTRMRIIMKDGTISGPCISYTYGEVEDYSVYLSYDGLMYADNTWIPNAPNATTGSLNALVLNGNCAITSDVAINDIEIDTNGSMTISKTGSLSVNGDLTVDNNLVLESDSNEYSSLIVTGSVSSNVVYKRHVNTNVGGNDLIAPPVSGQIFSDFILSNSNIYSNPSNTSFLFGPFDKVSGAYVLYSNTESSALAAGTGYRAASTDNDTFTFSGLVNTGNVNVSILNSGPYYEEWNLIGNPYTSYISLSEFLSANNSQFDIQNAGVYGYDGSASDGWEICNQAFSDANPGAVISPGQGFLVASKAGGGTVSFTPSMRSTGTTDDFIVGRSSNTNAISHLKIKLEDAGQFYYTDFYFTDNASLGLDPGYDAGIFGNAAPDFSIYSYLVDENTGLDMAIQSVSNTDLNNNIIIPLGISAGQGQQLSISIENTTLDPNVEVYFEDNLTNTVTLLNTNDYIFTSNTELSGIGRFFLRFESGTLSTIENELDSLNIYNTTNPEILHVKGLLSETSQLRVFDVQGRKVFEYELRANVYSQQMDISHLGIGIYVVEIKNFNQTKAKKFITM